MKCSGCSAPQCLTVRTVTTCIPIHSCHVARIASSSSSCTSSSGSCCCPTAALPNNNRSYQEASTARQHVVARAGFGFGAKSKAGSSKANSKDCPCGSGKLYSVSTAEGCQAGPAVNAVVVFCLCLWQMMDRYKCLNGVQCQWPAHS